MVLIALMAGVFAWQHRRQQKTIRTMITRPTREPAERGVDAGHTVPSWAQEVFGPEAELMQNRLIAAFHDEEATQRSAIGGHLMRLVTQQIPLVNVSVDDDTGAGRLVFADGTLVVCSGPSNINWLSLRSASEPARLRSVWVGMPKSRLKFQVGNEMCVLTATGLVLVPST